VIAPMKPVIAVSTPGSVSHHDCFFSALSDISSP
jgi:hypothetical protein